MIAGALALGLMSVFSLQSGVSNRLSDTADSQVVQASYQNDVQAAAYVTTAPTSGPQCGGGTGTQILGMESDPDTTQSSPLDGDFLTVISYVEVPLSGSTYALERLYCSTPSTALIPSYTPLQTTTLSYDLPSVPPAATIGCVTGTSTSCSSTLASQQWIATTNVTEVTLPVVQPKSNDPYTLISTPVDSTSSTDAGSPLATQTNTKCEFASPNTGAYSNSLCFVNFSNVSGPALAQATGGGCLEMSVSLPNNYILYFCLQITAITAGSVVEPWYLPTYPEAFLGNVDSIGGVTTPFYTGVSGDPALYQRTLGAKDEVTLSNISVLSPTDVLATDWEVVSADAESTDDNESLTWTSNVNEYVIPNGLSVDSSSDPVGNACQAGAGLSGNGTTTVECAGGTVTTSSTKNGATMVEAETPNWMSCVMVGTGLQAITFGLLVSG
jgi:hypothetical protein